MAAITNKYCVASRTHGKGQETIKYYVASRTRGKGQETSGNVASRTRGKGQETSGNVARAFRLGKIWPTKKRELFSQTLLAVRN